jgi:phosphopantothenoylcysteine decarboxylase/phosphopantothenate--cysteine ligase
MNSEEVIVEHILTFMAKEHDLKGKRFLITAGPTQESIDPVRYITNHSSGKMGYAIAKMARLRGADVTLVSGPVNIKPFSGIDVVPVKSAADMFEAVTSRSNEADMVIMCSAVADYTPAEYSAQKVKKHDGELSIELTRTQDILGWLGEHKHEGQTLVGFSMETENLIENSRTKLLKKHADLICANSISGGNTGFAVDTNQVTLITQHEAKELPLCSKEETADKILDFIATLS